MAAAVSGVDELLGIRHTHHADGTATAELTLLPECFDHGGGVASGVLMMLADIVLARTSLQVLPADRRIATSNLHVDLIASPMTALGSIVCGSARVDAIVDAGVRCRADLVDSRGELIAVASARFAILAMDSPAAAPVATVPEQVPRQRGLARIGDAPMHQLLDFQLLDVVGRTVRLAMPASPRWGNDRGGVHGGVGALIGEQAAGIALRQVSPTAVSMRPFDMRALFFRPIPAQGALIECSVEVVHVGRSLASTRACVHTPDGRLAVVVDVLHAPRRESESRGVHVV
jgi:uncharacterized protein (TIGR00369 family)